MASSETTMGFCALKAPLAGSTAFGCSDTFFCFPSGISMYFSSKSPIFAMRKDFGMRLIRSSTRVRRLWACRAYWARSFRARSVTGEGLMLGFQSAKVQCLTLKLEVVNKGLLLAFCYAHCPFLRALHWCSWGRLQRIWPCWWVVVCGRSPFFYAIGCHDQSLRI